MSLLGALALIELRTSLALFYKSCLLASFAKSADQDQIAQFRSLIYTLRNGTSIFPSISWLIAWCLTPFSTVFQLYHGGQCIYRCFPRVLLTSTPHNILSKPLATVTHYHCRNNGQRNESCCKDYHQSSERILAEPWIEPASSCSQVRNTTDWAMGLGPLISYSEIKDISTFRVNSTRRSNDFNKWLHRVQTFNDRNWVVFFFHCINSIDFLEKLNGDKCWMLMYNRVQCREAFCNLI